LASLIFNRSAKGGRFGRILPSRPLHLVAEWLRDRTGHRPFNPVLIPDWGSSPFLLDVPLIDVRRPISPHISADHAAHGADHATTQRSNGHFIGETIAAQCCAVIAGARAAIDEQIAASNRFSASPANIVVPISRQGSRSTARPSSIERHVEM